MINSLFDSVFEDLILPRFHWEDTIKRESIPLWPRGQLGRFHKDGLEVGIEGHDNVATFALFDLVYRSKPIAEVGQTVTGSMAACFLTCKRP